MWPSIFDGYAKYGGGANRPHYEPASEKLSFHPWFQLVTQYLRLNVAGMLIAFQLVL